MNQDKITCIIVDDEPLARKIIRECLQQHPDIDIQAEYGNPLEAYKKLQNQMPDLMFLDIQMPELTGFELLEQLNDPPVVIFCTAYDKFAIKAFEANAVDYLVKPFNQERFDKALVKARNFIKGEQNFPKLDQLLEFVRKDKSETEKILVKDGNQLVLLMPLDIYWVEAQEDYSLLHCVKDQYLVLRTLQELERRFAAYSFKRVHRSALVNFEMVKEIHPWSSGRYLLKMKNGDEIESSKSGARIIKDMLL